MNNKTNIEEDINICKNIIKQNNEIVKQTRKNNDINAMQLTANCDKESKAIENILVDRERLLEDKEILEDNYKILSESISTIAKELNLQEDATIDEIYTAIRILKSKRLN